MSYSSLRVALYSKARSRHITLIYFSLWMSRQSEDQNAVGNEQCALSRVGCNPYKNDGRNISNTESQY
jgi:hypothetical protein